MNRLRLLTLFIITAGIVLLSGTSCLLGDQNYIATQAALAGEKAIAAGKTQAAALGQTAIAAGKTEVADLAKTAVVAGGTEAVHLKETAQAAVGTQGMSAFGTLAAQQVRDAILRRAKSWIDADVPYNQAGSRDGYRTDCSGFVSYAWQLKKDGAKISPDTVALGSTYARDIPFSALQPGDILNNKRPGNSGHAVIFVEWVDTQHTRFTAYEENAGPGKAVQTQLTLAPEGEGYTIQEYSANAPGPWYAQTYVTTP